MKSRANIRRSEGVPGLLPDGQFRALLTDARIKVMPARVTLLQILSDEKHPVTAATLFKKILQRKEHQGLNEATVYRSLETLVRAGLIERVIINHNRAYYETAERTHHHHAVCTSCGEVEEIEGCLLKDKGLGLRKFSTMKSHSLEFFGLCMSCDKK